MTVAELIEALQGIDDPERKVILQRDAEGNGFSPMDDWCESLYRPETTWSGQALHPQDIEEGYYSDEALEAAEKVVVFCPVN